MKQRIFASVLVAGSALAVASPAWAQRWQWGRESEPESGVCFYKDPEFRGEYFCARGGESERFEMEGGAGQAWTKQEQQAAARKGTRQLTRDDPAPQTIYRVSTADNKALLVNVRLR